MSNKRLQGKRIAFLATNGFEQVELTRPWDALKEAGAVVELISPKAGKIQGMNHDEKADTFLVDNRNPNDLDAFCREAIEEFSEGRHAKQPA